jgi:hypothetical protein
MKITDLKENADIQQIASQLKFLPTHKKDLTYSPFAEPVNQANIDSMPALSFGKSGEQFQLETVTEDGHETVKAVNVGDVIVSGPSKEKYNIGPEAKLAKNYPIEAGNGRRKPDINAVRMVAKYTGSQPVSFTAPWGSPMTLKPGDYLVQEPGTQDQFYRVARYEYEQTYNPPGE